MNKVFIGGSRRISRLSDQIRARIERMIDADLLILLGDANGADKAVQAYLKSRNYDLVEIFCAGASCRNNVGHWRVRSISAESLKGFDFYAAKDRAMANEASYGFMIWDGESVGTLMNVVRLVRQKKPAVIYVGPTKSFVDLRNPEDFRYFLADSPLEVQQNLEAKAASELKVVDKLSQASLL
jgi:hypothetical protein